jgi:hypothetical protein
MNLQQMLEKSAASIHGDVEPGSDEEQEAIRRFQRFFENLTEETVRKGCRETYAAGAILHDTLKTIEGIDAIEHYFIKTAQRAAGVEVQVEDICRSGECHYVRWFMTIRWSAFGRKTTANHGVSLIRFNKEGKVQLHHDFWDSTNGFFIHLPVVGWMLRRIIRRV